MLRVVVVDSTPLIALYEIDKIEILQQLYKEVYIPEVLYRDLLREDKYKKLTDLDFIKVQKMKDEDAQKFPKTSLHKGGIEIMLLAEDLSADLCIIDDLSAREYAKRLGYHVTGTIGILLKAKEKGYVEEIKPLLDDLKNSGIYIDEDLCDKIIEIANE